MRTFMVPNFGFGDEARLLFRDGRQVWGGMALFRGPDDEPFDKADIAFLASLSGQFARGVRSGLLSRLADAPPPSTPGGPAVLIIGADNQIAQMSMGPRNASPT